MGRGFELSEMVSGWMGVWMRCDHVFKLLKPQLEVSFPHVWCSRAF